MWLGRLHEWVGQGVPCALATVVAAEGSTPRGPGAKMAISATGEQAGSVGGGRIEHLCREAAREAIRTGQPRSLTLCLEGGDWVPVDGMPQVHAQKGCLVVFIEPILPPMELVLFGAGHVSEALGRLCAVVGMPYRVYDSRPGFPTEERFPDARERVLAPYDHLAEHIRLGPASHCVILTHAHAHDELVLEQLLAVGELPYIGVLGSKTKLQQAYSRMGAKGLEPGGRVYGPVGLALGGGLPGDIALSILAEVRMLVHGGSPRHLRL